MCTQKVDVRYFTIFRDSLKRTEIFDKISHRYFRLQRKEIQYAIYYIVARAQLAKMLNVHYSQRFLCTL